MARSTYSKIEGELAKLITDFQKAVRRAMDGGKAEHNRAWQLWRKLVKYPHLVPVFNAMSDEVRDAWGLEIRSGRVYVNPERSKIPQPA